MSIMPLLNIDTANDILNQLVMQEIECFRCNHVIDIDILVNAAFPRRIPFKVDYEGSHKLPVYVFSLIWDNA